LLFAAAFKVCGFPQRLLATNGTMLAGASIVTLAVAGYGLRTVASALTIYFQSLLILGLLVLFALISWNRVLDDSDHRVVLNLTKLRKRLETT
jgi:hypothetical protein